MDQTPVPQPESPPASMEALPDGTVSARDAALERVFIQGHEPSARVRVTVEAAPGATVLVEVVTADGCRVGQAAYTIPAAGSPPLSSPGTNGKGLLRRLPRARAASLTAWLVGASLLIYALTRLIALDLFPVYFFTDEAVQSVLAADFLRDHYQNYDHEIFPTYFKNGAQYNLSTSIYLQVIPYLLFGKEIWVTRGAAALATLAAAASMALIAKRIFNDPYPWLAVLFLTVTPAWFLHSRTAFETSLAVTCYAVFLYCYLMYRTRAPRYLLGSVIAAALTFYSYNPARMVIAVTALLLFLSDLKYHLANWRWLLRGLVLLLALALPFARFWLNHPAENTFSMRLLGSYWISDMTLAQKLGLYAGKYLSGLDPLYWYLPNRVDLIRHTMLGYGHLLRQTLPLGLLGLFLALKRFKRPEYRALLACVLAAPSGAAMVDLGITRALFMVIPMALLTALAASFLIDWARRRFSLSPVLVVGPVFLLLAAASGFMLYDAVTRGPFWTSDYSMTGLQYGARQLFGELREYVRLNPRQKVTVSPSWANGTDVVARFFFDDPLPFVMGNADSYYHQHKPLDPNNIFVLTPAEYNAIPVDRFAKIDVRKTLPDPTGQPGFYFVHLEYVKNIDDVLLAEAQERLALKQETIYVDGQPASVHCTRSDIGTVQDLFDGDPNTLFRTEAINPLQVRLAFPAPRTIRRVALIIGGVRTVADARIFVAGQEEPVAVTQQAEEQPNPRTLTLDFGREYLASELWIEVRNAADGAEGNVHLWEIMLR